MDLYKLGLGFEKQGDGEKALKAYNQALVMKPNFPEALLKRANIKRDELADYAGAIADYNKAIGLKANFLAAFEGRAVAFLNQGKPMDAMKDINKVLSLSPGNLEFLDKRAQLKSEWSDYQGAIADYEAILKRQPKDDIARFGRAQNLEHARRYVEAAQDYRLVMAHSSSRGLQQMALNGLGVSLIRADKPGEARQAYDAFLAKHPKDAFVLVLRGEVYNLLEEFKKAVADFDKALKLDASLTHAYINRGFAKERLGDLKGAEADYREAMKDAAEKKKALEGLARLKKGP